MKNMEFSRKNLEALKNRVAVVALATVVAFMGTGCGKEKTDDTTEVGYNLIADSGRTSGLYSYVINGEGLESEKYLFDDDFVKLMKVSEREVYNNDNSTTAFFRKNIILKINIII